MKHVFSFKKRVFGIIILMLCVSSFSVMGQLVTVKGVVKDVSGNVLPGVGIRVVGTNTGNITDVNGKYTVHVAPTAKLTFSYIGFLSQTIPVNGVSTINVTLHEQEQRINEVVVVGYGTMRKLDVTGSIVSTNAKTIAEVPASSVTQALQGRLPGIEMSQTSTTPGAQMQIRIRGTRSLNATNDPLIVVDGIPFSGNLNDIDPSDIKSVDILKDASSTAIYGSRGANGVILVTTFKGMNNEKPTITYNGYYGVKSVSKSYPVFNGTEFQAFRSASLESSTYPNTPLEQADIASGSYTDWQKLVYQTAAVTNHDFNISAGTKKGSYMFGSGFYDETSVLPGQDYKRYTIRTTIDQEIGKYIKVGLSSQNSYAVTDGASAGQMNNILTIPPIDPAYNADGSICIYPMAGSVDATYVNPLQLKVKGTWAERRKRFASFNSLYAEVSLPYGIKYRANLGLSYFNENYGNFFGSLTPFQSGGASSATVQNIINTDWTIENLLYYNKVFAEKHRLGLTAMFSTEQSEYNQSQMSASGIDADYLLYYNLGLSSGTQTIAAPNQNYNARGLMSYMMRATYAYADKYLMTATFRADAASVLSPGKQWHYYPAISLAWNANQEDFLKNVSAISQLKLRLGYGQTSNQAISPYSTLGGLTQNAYNFGTTNLYGFYVSSLPNKNLGWEFTENYNAGIDFGFLNSRITGSLDAYYEKTKDLLVSVALPPTSGVSNNMMQNVGSTENKGIEFAVTAKIIDSKNGGFTWDMDFNIYANRNKLLSLNSGVTQDIGNGFFVGQPINVIYDYKKIGIWQINEASKAASYGYTPGQIKVADLNNDGKITSADMSVIGHYDPNFEGGLSTRFGFKGFDLAIVSFFRQGGMLASTVYQPQSYLLTNSGRRNEIKIDYWTPTHPTNAYPQPGNQSGDQITLGSTLGYFNASFVKIRTITLGYTFQKQLLSVIGCESARIYVTCQNPFVFFSPYVQAGGLDPETTGYGNQGVGYSGSIQSRQLTIGANTPPTRNYLVGVNLTF